MLLTIGQMYIVVQASVGIKIIRQSMKLMGRVIDNRIRREAVIREEQLSFMSRGYCLLFMHISGKL